MEQASGSSADTAFNFPELCFICGKKLDKKHKKVITVPNDGNSRDRLLHLCEMTATNASDEVRKRIESVPSLVNVNAQYHKDCYGILNKVLYPEKFKKRDLAYEAALQKVFDFIVNSDRDQFSLEEFKEIMANNFRNNEALYKALEEHFGNDISIIQSRGKQPKFFYKKKDIASICSNWHYDKENMSVESQRFILKVAADILSSQIIKSKYNHSSYPPASSLLDNVGSDIPSLLDYFLSELIDDGNDSQSEGIILKKHSIAHSIISILKPKSFISTLQLAVGTYIYRKTGSKLIINILSKLGVSANYQALQVYEASTIINPAKFDPKDSFVQFVFDNTDHNVSTLDGKETFHCLGGIGIYTPCGNVSYEGNTKKLNKMPDASTLAKQKQIRTIPYPLKNKTSLEKIIYQSVSSMDLSSPELLPQHYSAYLWAKYLRVEIPSWGGFMEVITSHMDYSVSHIVCLPFINEPPSNFTTLNTSLNHALEETIKQKQKICFVTYDQPLYLKARSIVSQSSESKYQNVVVRLGGFHLLMSYLGAIGHIMGGSGIEELWAVIYAQQSTKKMISGHAYSRAMRAHILTFTAIGIMICEAITYEKEAAKKENREAEQKFEQYLEQINKIKSTFSNWATEPPFLHDIKKDETVKILTQEFTGYLGKISKNNPTAKLWSQYLEAVSVALQFIEAERLANWNLHLQSVKKMLPIFHASGHFAYAKSAQVYLQDMLELEIKMDHDEYDKFTKEGYFTIRRSYKAWSGVWTDMTIEQTLNRFFGTDLKHGRGVTPSVVARYLLGMPAAFNVMENLEEYLDLKSSNSEQHTDLSISRMQKDSQDVACLLEWFRTHNPFVPCDKLISLSTGIMGNEQINCYEAYKVGEEGMKAIIGENANCSLTKLYKVKNLLQATSLHVQDTAITINPLMLFQRISLVIHGDETKMRKAFQYELSPYPLSLFDEQGLMRKTTKSSLYKVFKPYLQMEALIKNSPVVIDGGWLLHQIIWPHSRTFGEIFDLYHTYLVSNYGDNITVVFDGYYNNILGVKSYERYRRQEYTVGADICIAEDNINTLNQKKFLSNIGNKVKIVQKLLCYLRSKGIEAQVAAEDADSLIVDIALQQSRSTRNPITVVGNDVDLLILLVALVPNDKPIYFYKIVGGKSKNVMYSTKDQQEVKEIILFAHAFAGCDSTSAFYNKGKKTIINIIQSHPDIKKQISVFYQPNNTIEQLYPVAEKIVCLLYDKNKKKPSTMESLRYNCFKTALTSSKKEISLSILPPTKSALKEHVKRVYYQIQLWNGRASTPEDWGWEKTHTMYLPVLNTEEPAPEELLQLIHCSCTGDCASRQCSCKKMGLKCNQLCRHCNGESCLNRQTVRININEGDSEDEDEPEERYVDRENNEDNDDQTEENLGTEHEVQDTNEDQDEDDEDQEEDINEEEDDDNRIVELTDDKMDVDENRSTPENE